MDRGRSGRPKLSPARAGILRCRHAFYSPSRVSDKFWAHPDTIGTTPRHQSQLTHACHEKTSYHPDLPMSRKLPPLTALRAFEAAARCGNFTRAAQELFVTQGAVSRHIATLETALGVRLFERSRHGIVLTPPGQAYFATVRTALDQIEHGTR